MKIRTISASMAVGMAVVAVLSILFLGRAQLVQAGLRPAHAAPVRAAPRGAAADATIQFGGELGFQYSPKQATISPGDSVTWVGDFTMHPLVSDEGVWQTVNTGTTFTRTFDQPGTYHFHCFVHGGAGGAGMSGTVVVQAAGGGFSVFLPIIKK